MIDLRSDTLTKPTQSMMEAITKARLGDDGRLDSSGKGEDPTVNRLEKFAAFLTGKEDALFCNSGTMANLVALLTSCNRGDYVGVDPQSHIYQNENSIFMEDFFGLNPLFYQSDETGEPELDYLNRLFADRQMKLLCLENPLANKGGTCLSIKKTEIICKIAADYCIPVHLDGARIFNAAFYWDLPVERLTGSVTSVQFCLSKGLGAPVGSMLCGNQLFIQKARRIRRLLGGEMRQAGIIAAAGIEALNNSNSIQKDNKKARILANLIKHNTSFYLNIGAVQTNMIVIDISQTKVSANLVQEEWRKQGLFVKAISDKKIRMTIHRHITSTDIINAASIINNYFYEVSF